MRKINFKKFFLLKFLFRINILRLIQYINYKNTELKMDENKLKNELRAQIGLERAEFISRLMIDAPLTQRDVQIGLCLLHESLIKIQLQINNKNYQLNSD